MPLKQQNKPAPASKSKKYVEACVRVEQAKVDFRLLSVGEETAESKASRKDSNMVEGKSASYATESVFSKYK